MLNYKRVERKINLWKKAKKYKKKELLTITCLTLISISCIHEIANILKDWAIKIILNLCLYLVM